MNKIITIVVCLTLTALLHAQTILYVTPDGTGDGTSWANACNLEIAMKTAVSGDQIWVQSGTHYPSRMLVVPASVEVYGSFAGTENNLSQRDFVANPTIVDGQQKIGSIFRLKNSAEINGFIIQNGNANGNPQKNGGGVWADNNAIIENCIIQKNAAIANGGGVYAKGNLTLISSTVENNTAGDGADLYGNCITQVIVPTPITIAGCSDGTFNFGDVSFQTNNEYTITGTVDGQPLTQIWSDAVTATNCQKTAFTTGYSSAYLVDCRSNPDYSGDLFSWCAVACYATALCPGDWRVPTRDDFINLDKAMGGIGANGQSNNTKYINSWGGAYGGYCGSDGSLINQDLYSAYWSQTEYSSDRGYNLYLTSNGYIFPQFNTTKNLAGFTLRCVK